MSNISKTSETTAVKKTPQPDIEVVMTVDEKKQEIAEVEAFLAVKKQELQELIDLGVKSEAESSQVAGADEVIEP